MSRPRNASRKAPSLYRRIDTRKTRDSFLIVCEGEKTEPNYFKNFRVNKKIEVVGVGFNTVSLIERTIQIKNETKEAYDQVWCVFDKDSFSDEDFNAAITLAEKNQIKSAYSNEAFELWYLLHFSYHQTAISRNLYNEKLSKRFGRQYQKNAPDVYEVLADKQADAIRNADMLLKAYNPHNPAKDNPCTTVHLLVQELVKSGPGSKTNCDLLGKKSHPRQISFHGK